jgi:hypothetical protein
MICSKQLLFSALQPLGPWYDCFLLSPVQCSVAAQASDVLLLLLLQRLTRCSGFSHLAAAAALLLQRVTRCARGASTPTS